MVIGIKFKSITHLELYQLAMERHYKSIAQMITSWGAEGDTGANQLTDLKIFFSKEAFTPDGTPLK